MSQPPTKKATLVVTDGTSPHPKLRARRCECGHTMFPPQAYGCERCGRSGEATTEIEIDPRGTLAAVAVVHAHPKLPTPFTLGHVVLDAGPTVDVRLEQAEKLTIGGRVRGRVFPVSDATGTSFLDCRFVPEGTAP